MTSCQLATTEMSNWLRYRPDVDQIAGSSTPLLASCGRGDDRYDHGGYRDNQQYGSSANDENTH